MGLLSRAAEFLPPGPLTFLRYVRKFRRPPRLFPPVTFNEHITHRLIFDRDPRLKTVCDKIAVKDFIAGRAGSQYVVPLLGSWSSASDVAWSDLPERFAIKPSFTSGPFELVGPEVDRQALESLVATWLPRRPPHHHFFEWGYQGIPRRIMAEPLLGGDDGDEAPEVDVYVFNGRALLLRVMTGRKLTRERRDAWLDRDGRQLEIRTRKIASRHYELDMATRRELIEMSEAVARDFTFMRVDAYLSSDGLKVGELTAYPWGGRVVWTEPRFDVLMGRLFHPGASTAIFEDFRG